MPNQQSLEVHFISGGIGESIVLRLPTGEWGVVDCYASSIQHPATNPTVSFLKQHGVTRLHFVCLTHPHVDHFRGMSQLLRNFQVEQFWRFPGLPGNQLNNLAQYFAVDARKAGEAAALENASEFTQILALAARTTPQIAVARTQLFPFQFDQDAACQILAIAPSGAQIIEYERHLLRCVHRNQVQGKMPRDSHNIISIALLVRFGKTTIILGGDVEGAGWQDACDAFQPTEFAASAVKVSHHGSNTGWIEGLWDRFSQRGAPLAVICPFYMHYLPDPETLDHIGNFTSSRFTTCLPAMRTGPVRLRLSPNASPASRQAIQRVFDVSEGPYACGQCSFTFDDQGNCIDTVMLDPAGMLP